MDNRTAMRYGKGAPMSAHELPRRKPLALLVAALVSTAAAQQPGAAQSDGPPEGIEEIVTIGRARSTSLDVVGARLENDVVSDYLTAAAIARVGDGTASAALRRMPGVTLVDDRFVYVRGLGERYSSVQLNGAQVPSPDLTRNVIPLDLFPAEIIDALEVQKGYSPEAPAAFGGGNVDIRTRSIPSRPTVNIEIGSGVNSDGSRTGHTYNGGRRDGLGRDDGTRAFPRALKSALEQYRGRIGPNGILATLNGAGGTHTIADAQAVNRELAVSLNRDVEIEEKDLSPDGSLELTLGNRWFLSDDDRWELGALGLLSYDNSWRNRERVERDIADPLTLVENKLRTINQVTATGIVNLGLHYTSDHEISTSSLLLRNTDDESAIATRTNNNFQRADGRQLRDYEIRYEQRELRANQIRGRHIVGLDTREAFSLLDRDWLDGLTIDWYVSDSTAETDIPNEVRFSAEDTIDPVSGEVLSTAIRRTSSAADYRFTYLKDRVRSSGWDLTKPYTFGRVDLSLSGGQDVSDKARSYDQTQFGLGTTAPAAAPILAGRPTDVFTDANILNPLYGFELSAGGIGTESYLAAQATDAAYVKADASIDGRWRIAGGLRWEDFRQASLPIDRLQYDVSRGQCALVPCDAAALERIVLAEDDVYPAASLTRMLPGVWAEDFQLRLNLSRTVARPDLREVSGSSYIDPLTETRIRGNPELRTSAIENVDLRAEWFFENGDNFTVSLFYKDIERPIETVQAAGTDDNISLTFVNAESAKLRGVEVDWLKDLATLGPKFLAPFFFSGNVTLGDSELRVGDVGLNLTSPVRPMAQHSEYVANLQLGFDSPNGAHTFTLAYNTFGERLFFAGRDGAPDAYERPFDSLDFVYTFFPTDRLRMKLRIQNLLDEEIEIAQRDTVVISQKLGTTAKIDVQWNVGR